MKYLCSTCFRVEHAFKPTFRRVPRVGLIAKPRECDDCGRSAICFKKGDVL